MYKRVECLKRFRYIVKHVYCNNASEYQVKLIKSYEKHNIKLDYSLLHKPQTNRMEVRRMAVLLKGTCAAICLVNLNKIIGGSCEVCRTH